MRMTVPEVLSTSTLPSLTNWVGETYPETESRSILRTMTFLCVEGIFESGLSARPQTSDLSPQLCCGSPKVRGPRSEVQGLAFRFSHFWRAFRPESLLAVAKM